MKKGFTLVELTIVLVIIGLLIGGILIGQSMVITTKVQGVLRQIGQYDAAISNFRTKFKQLPGDSNLLPNPGNNDGLINGEGVNTWYHLSLGVGLKSDKNQDYISSPTPPTDLSNPKFNLPQPGQAHLTVEYYLHSRNQYYYIDRNFMGFCMTDPLSSGDLLAIDLKVDDGLPYTGKVLGANNSGIGGACVTASSKYEATGRCTMYADIGIISGEDFQPR